jgi:predicted permease
MPLGIPNAGVTDIMLSDLRYAFRALRHHPSFSIVAILSIALGIGVNSMIFSLADALLLRPLQVPDAGRVLNLRSQLAGNSPMDMSYPDFRDFQSRTKAFKALAAFRILRFGVAKGKNELPEMTAGLLTTGNFFDALRVAPRLGRAYGPAEDSVPGRDAVAVISDDTWHNQFSGSPEVIGRPLYVNGVEFKIIGVAPASFPGVDNFFRPALYIPIAMSKALAPEAKTDWTEDRSDRDLGVKGRLATGTSQAEAAAEARVIASGLEKAYPATNRRWTAAVRTDMQARMDQSPYDTFLVGMLLGLAGVVLLIACANVANLMLGRALSRSGEIAIRMAIGAGRWRVTRQLLAESLLLTVFAGALGLVLAQTGMASFLPWRIPSELPIDITARIDYRVISYALCTAVLSALVCGLAPAIRVTRQAIEPALRASGRNMESRRSFLGRDALVVGQVAGSLVLLICASQMYLGFSAVMSAPPGFRSDHILMASFDTTLARYDEAHSRTFYKRLVEKARELPGVTSAALAIRPPIANNIDEQAIVPEGYRLPPGREAVNVLANTVSEDYFTALNIPIVSGRAFQQSDTADSRKVAVVNRRLAEKYFPNQDPVGKRFRLDGPQGDWVDIVGVAKNSKYAMVVEPPIDFVYFPVTQKHQSNFTLFVQTAGPSSTAAPAIRNLVRSLDPGQPIFGVRTMEQYFQDRGVKTVTVLTGLVGGMGLLGLALALSGLYGVMAFSVARRTREIGIRMAVGAGRNTVLGMVLRQGLKLSLVGAAIGLVLSVAAGRVISASAGTPSFNIPTLVFVVAALVGITAIGAYVPARRASKLDPITVLRQD